MLTLAGAALVAGAGWAALFSFGKSVVHLSYDLPFAIIYQAGRYFPSLRRPPPADVCLVYMDDNAAKELGQSSGIWDRRLHASLIRRLTSEGARAILLDLVFVDPSDDPEVDKDFAAALKENGHVFLSGGIDVDTSEGGDSERVTPPTPVLRRAAAGWGLAAFRAVDSDYGVRYLYAGNEQKPTASWLLAEHLGAPLQNDYAIRAQPRWLNFYGPVGCFKQIGYDRAVLGDMPPGFFKNKIVFVGGRSSLGTLGLGKDDFGHPHTRWDNRYSPGLEIHVTAFLNLFRSEWLTRWNERREDWFITIFGLLVGAVLPRFRPPVAAAIGSILFIIVNSYGTWLVWHQHLWFAWAVPGLIQLPLAITYAMLIGYLLEERGRKALRNAFSHYLSPQMADRIANEQFDLRPGGTLVEATIMFTDLEGFTALSEKLNDPERLAQILTEYFTRTTGHVLENDGTIIKYIGDSVMAVWGAPLPDPEHPSRAATAAWRLHGASYLHIDGRVIRTRVGLHTGRVLSGNLGSAQRFDYTVIGDPVNLASRLEGLNKYLGTDVLVTETTRDRIGSAFLSRDLGRFLVAGKSDPVTIHELLGPAGGEAPPAWRAVFAQGLASFQAGDFEGARKSMEEVCSAREGGDGPSKFYLKWMDDLGHLPLPRGWSGVIEVAMK